MRASWALDGDEAVVRAAKGMAQQACERAIAEHAIVAFGCGIGSERFSPQSSEQAAGLASAQPVGAFAAHPDGRRSFGHAAAAREGGQEADLALDRPPVAAAAAGSG